MTIETVGRFIRTSEPVAKVVPKPSWYPKGVTLLEALATRVLLGDGANGTLLAERGFKKQPYDLANLEAADLVLAVHREYIEAGADFIETNTFCSNPFKLEGRGVSIFELNKRGAEIAREAAGEKFVMGAVGPCGKPLAPFGHIEQDIATAAFTEIATGLVAGGVDGFFLESFVDLGEIEIAVAAIRAVSDLPVFVSKAFIEDGEMLAEGLPSRCAREMSASGAVAVGANCIVGPQRMLDLVRMMAEESELPIIAFPTPGLPQLVKGEITYDTSPEYFAKATARLVEEGARVIGGCCGTTPAHIRAMREMIDRGIKVKPRTVVTRTEKEKEELIQTPPSTLSEKISEGKFVVAIEMDVPRGLRIQKLIAGAKKLKEAGCDVINISDGARARLRMNPTAVSTLIQNEAGIEATMHFSCRDRNLLAVQSDLLGAHALGIRNILAVTGDPANIGDYPSATSVFDIDAIGLCRIMSRFNEGVDLAGYSVGMKTAFTICAAYNPCAIDQALEDDRLARKVAAGATLIYTQPVFDLADAQRSVEACKKLGVAVLVGILPLRSARHAEFMHNEVPGISIPEALRAKIAGAASDEIALEIGIEDARQLCRDIKGANGIYLMPPFGNADIAARVMEAVR
jgi:homocysteine S-methyltransferase